MVTTRIIDSEPALIVEEERKNLVISDLHIGFEHKFSSNKNTIENNSSIKDIISNVKKIIKKENPDTLILLGDVKSSIQNITKTEWNDVPYFFEEIKNSLDIILIPGNHDSNIDRLIPNDVTLIGSKGMIISENKWENEISLYSSSSTSNKAPLLNFFIERYKDAYKNQLNDFAKFIKKNIRPLAEFEEGRRALIIANAARKSLISKKFDKLTF